jgi:hypothetical protein
MTSTSQECTFSYRVGNPGQPLLVRCKVIDHVITFGLWEGIVAGIFDELLQQQQQQRLAAGAPAAPAMDWGSIYGQALAEAQAQDPTFAADFGQLSADAKEELQLAVLGPVQEAVSNPDFDVEAVRAAFEQASFEVTIEGTTFRA